MSDTACNCCCKRDLGRPGRIPVPMQNGEAFVTSDRLEIRIDNLRGGDLVTVLLTRENLQDALFKMGRCA